MVSQTLPRDAEWPPQVRPIDPARDLTDIAHVIEVAFADELSPGGHIVMRELRTLNSLGPLLRALAFLIPSLTDVLGGFVWEEDGRVIGNITLTPLDSAHRQWVISNVAVLPAYRRQGVAHAMMRVAVENARRRGGRRILLQVRHDNWGAKSLYEKMGFEHLETVTEMQSDVVRLTDLPAPEDVEVRRPDPQRWYEAYDVARAAVPARVQAVRPLRPQSFRITERSWLGRLWDQLFGVDRERWWVEHQRDVVGLLTIEREMSRTGEQVELLLHPDGVGLVESALVNRLSASLHGHRRARTSVPASLTEARTQLRHAGFYELRTLDQMSLDLTRY